MRVIERLRNYIETEIEAGNLHSGGRLPSLRTLTEILGGSYVTMQNAMEKLEKERIVEVKNTGTYLSGNNSIRVFVSYPGSDLPKETLSAMLRKHLANAELYLDIEVHENGEIRSLEDLKKIESSCSACITIDSALRSDDDHLPAADLRELPDYEKHLATLINFPVPDRGTQLPFIYSPACMGINRNLMKKIGFDYSKIDASFDWWEEYTGKCRKAGLPASVIHWDRKHLFLQSSLLYLIVSLCGFSEDKIHGSTPYFNTPAGRRMMKILDQVEFRESPCPSMSYFHNETPFLFQLGSWFSVQNNNPDHPEVTVDSPEAIPYRGKDGKALFINNRNSLEIWFHKNLVFEERKRIWKLVKIMTGRDFQLDYCGKTGMVSCVRDIYPTEYYWNRDGRWSSFFPCGNDTVIDRTLLFNRNIHGILSTLLEAHFFDGVPSETVLRLLDLKKMFPKRNK